MATNTVAPGALGAYGTVAANACGSCHNAHNNPAAARSLKAAEEAVCTSCHSGANTSPVLLNVTSEFSKTYAHPTMTVSGAHDPAEALPVNNTRHAECADCHNPHTPSPQAGTSAAPAIEPDLAGTSGYDTAGAQLPASKEYQVCYKCHADSTNKPLTSTYGRTSSRYPAGPMPAGYPIQPPKPADQYNVRLKFTSTIGHNVAGSSVVTTANSSLRPFMLNVDLATNNTSRPLTTTSILYCTDCHTNNQARSSNGTGPNGPHGSTFPHLLQFLLYQDAIGGGSGNSTAGSAMCAKCHNLTTVRGESPHGDHTGVACTTCHDPHGVIGGTPGANRAMQNFVIGIAAKATTYFGYFYISGGQKGCYTQCHGESHNPHTY